MLYLMEMHHRLVLTRQSRGLVDAVTAVTSTAWIRPTVIIWFDDEGT